MSLTELSEKVGVSIQNLSILKTGKARAIRFSTLSSICHALDCTPGDLISNSPGVITPESAASGDNLTA